MTTIVVYYSGSGNNKYLAEKIAQSLNCDCEVIKPRMNVLPFQVLFSLIKMSFGVRKLKHRLGDYDRIVMVGPIWMGQIASPLRNIIVKYMDEIKKLYFVTCCGSNETTKNDNFGYMGVFKKVQELLGDKCVLYKAFPIGLVLTEEEQGNDDAVMKIHLSDENFKGAIVERLEVFVQNFQE